jgi:hypothetical protein
MSNFELILETLIGFDILPEQVHIANSKMFIRSLIVHDIISKWSNNNPPQFEDDYIPIQLSSPIKRGNTIINYDTPHIFLERSKVEIIEHEERLSEQRERDKLDHKWISLDCDETSREYVRRQTEELKKQMLANQKYKDGKWVDSHIRPTHRLVVSNDDDIFNLPQWKSMPLISMLIRLRKLKRSDGVFLYPVRLVEMTFKY